VIGAVLQVLIVQYAGIVTTFCESTAAGIHSHYYPVNDTTHPA